MSGNLTIDSTLSSSSITTLADSLTTIFSFTWSRALCYYLTDFGGANNISGARFGVIGILTGISISKSRSDYAC